MIHHLNKCPSCGHYKRANTLCMYCVGQISHIWKTHTAKEEIKPRQEEELSELDQRVLYPGRRDTKYTKDLKDKDNYLERRVRTLKRTRLIFHLVVSFLNKLKPVYRNLISNCIFIV